MPKLYKAISLSSSNDRASFNTSSATTMSSVFDRRNLPECCGYFKYLYRKYRSESIFSYLKECQSKQYLDGNGDILPHCEAYSVYVKQ